jgi:Mn2+/Fe2+ NRAMP family transporter
MGPRYTAATGKNLIEGYKSLGKFQYYTYIFISIASMFIVLAAVTLVTGGLVAYLLPLGISITAWCGAILLICLTILLWGRYSAIDKSMKIIISLLTLLTFCAVIIAAFNIEKNYGLIDTPSLTSATSIAFIVAFMGWMPIPIDASIWHSIWTQEKSASTGKQTTARDALWDFNIGYFASSAIAILFFMLGVFIMFGSGLEFSNSSIAFSGQLIDLYAQTLGVWTKSFIAFIALITMFSTTLMVADAYPRVLSEFLTLERKLTPQKKSTSYTISLFLICIVALLIIQYGSQQFTLLVDFAAAVSFLAAPFLAWFNYQLFQQKEIKEQFKFKKSFNRFSLVCLLSLIIFNVIYLWSVFSA